MTPMGQFMPMMGMGGPPPGAEAFYHPGAGLGHPGLPSMPFQPMPMHYQNGPGQPISQ